MVSILLVGERDEYVRINEGAAQRVASASLLSAVKDSVDILPTRLDSPVLNER